jgi:(1->4)-alpha-D-glucan 1-alpha-D-glucosylmutase
MLAHQHYRPAYWRLSNQEGNYRRFFDIDGLIGVRVEDSAVFRRTHALLIAIGGDERIAGWRVDHIDGLTDPNSYSQHLAKSMEGRRRTRAVILVEKILAHDEEVPTNWVVDGTTGYEFADRAGGLFVDPNGARALLEVGQVTTGDTSTFADLALQGKRSVLTHLFGAPMARLSELVGEALDASHPGHDLSKSDVRQALVELTVHLNVYRTYLDGGPVERADRRRVAAAAAAAAAHATSTECQRALKLITEGLTSTATPWLEPARRWQQLTGAVMAKGVEDTATYRYSGLLGHAEVGCDPDHAGAQPEDFHRLARTHRRYPSSLNATATHDSKRSEDVRARLFAVSEVHDDWAALVARWRRRFRTTGTSVKGPDPHDEWAIYQALLGVWPFGTGGPDKEVRCRVQDYAVKSAREAKRRTAWVDPDTSYERSLVTFIDHVTQEQRFVGEMSGFVARIGPAAATNSLATVVLKAITPGVPDFYQGTELWDFSLTDPDNRRPVNFELGRELLDGLPRHDGSTPELAGAAKSLLADWQDGKVKLHLTRVLLHLRRLHPKLFARGSYHVLESKGTRRDHVVAIARHYRREWVVAVVPRQMIDVVGPARFPIGERAWGHTAIRLPRFATGEIVDVVTGCPITAQGGRIRLDACLSLLPVSVLTNLRSGTGSYSGTTETGGSPLAIRGTQEI